MVWLPSSFTYNVCCRMVPCASRDECGRCLSHGSTTNAQLSGGSALVIRLGFGACLTGLCTDDFVLGPTKN